MIDCTLHLFHDCPPQKKVSSVIYYHYALNTLPHPERPDQSRAHKHEKHGRKDEEDGREDQFHRQFCSNFFNLLGPFCSHGV